MLQSKKQLQQKDKKTVFSRDIVNKNPVFTKEQCQDFFDMFNLYCDNRRQCDMGDILNTARTLGFDKKYKIIFDAFNKINQELGGQLVDFQNFLKLLTERIGNPGTQNGRRAMFELIDPNNKQMLNFNDLKIVAQNLKYHLSDQQLQEVVNNVAGFGKKQISWQQFNRYIAKKTEKRML